MSTLERGFTLPEVMLALTFGSLLALAAAKTYPLLYQQSVAVGQPYYRLELLLQQLAFAMEKDLHRAGFCAGQCAGRALLIDHVLGEAAGSCVIVAYDINCSGQWASTGDRIMPGISATGCGRIARGIAASAIVMKPVGKGRWIIKRCA